MKYLSRSIPDIAKGVKIRGKKITLPNQSLSLEEILARFTRGEPLEIGKGEGQYDDGPDDLEKIGHMDLVERDEFVAKQKETQRKFKQQEDKKLKAQKERLDKLAVEKLAADKLAAEKAAGTAK